MISAEELMKAAKPDTPPEAFAPVQLGGALPMNEMDPPRRKKPPRALPLTYMPNYPIHRVVEGGNPQEVSEGFRV